MERTISRKEIFQNEVQTGTTIEEIIIYMHELELILAVNADNSTFIPKFLSLEENEALQIEVKDLKQKIRKYQKKVIKI